jgi:hypothetical protein
LRSSADGSPSRAVLAPSKRLPSGNVAHIRSEANAVRSEQATCAVTNHMRRTAGIFGPCSGALRSARAVRHRDEHTPHPSVCGAMRGAMRARRRSRGRSRGQCAHRRHLSRERQLSFRSGARCCGPLRSAQCTTATRTCRARLRAARQAAQRAPGAAALRTPAGGWAGHRWAAALVSTSSARA